MTNSYVEMQLRFPSKKLPELNMSGYEVSLIRELWDSLRLVGFTGTNPRANESSEKRIEKKRISVASVKMNEDQVNQFEFKLYSNMVQYLCLHYGRDGLDNRKIETDKFDIVRYDYQLAAILQLLSFIICNLGTLSCYSSIILDLSHISSRIWNFDANHYNIVGEALVLTILEKVGRERFSPEVEFVWLKFYNRLATLLISQGQEPSFDLPIMEDMSEGRLDSILTMTSASTRSSLFADEDIYSIRIPQEDKLPIYQKPSEFETQDLVKIREDEDEDDSYDLLNAFGSDDARKTKDKKLNKAIRNHLKGFNPRNRSMSLKRSNSDATRTSASPSIKSTRSNVTSESGSLSQECSIS